MHDLSFLMLSFKLTFHSPLSLSSRDCLVSLCFHKGGAICISEAIDIFFFAVLIPACTSSNPMFLIMYSAYKLNKRGDNIQP